MKIPWKITCSAQKSGYVQDASGLGAEEVIGSWRSRMGDLKCLSLRNIEETMENYGENYRKLCTTHETMEKTWKKHGKLVKLWKKNMEN